MTLGTDQAPKAYDLSRYVVHITRGKKVDPLKAFMSILGGRQLRRSATRFGGYRDSAPQAAKDGHRAVCFSEAPLGYLQRFAEHRGSCKGIGFTKSYILGKGGLPVWYLDKESPTKKSFYELVKQGKDDPDNPIWKITPFVELPNDDAPYRFEWEREWRLTADLNFEVEDVAFLLLEEDQQANLEMFMEAAYEEGIGPLYACPMVDPRWSLDTVKQVLGVKDEDDG